MIIKPCQLWCRLVLGRYFLRRIELVVSVQHVTVHYLSKSANQVKLLRRERAWKSLPNYDAPFHQNAISKSLMHPHFHFHTIASPISCQNPTPVPSKSLLQTHMQSVSLRYSTASRLWLQEWNSQKIHKLNRRNPSRVARFVS